MALNAKTAGNSQKPEQATLEPDVYPGRLVQVIDFGLQPQKPYQGKDKPPIDMVGFTYELVTEFMKDEDGNDLEDKPRWISELIPLHNLKAEKAKSTLRYKVFDPSESYSGDFTKCLDTPVNIIVTHNKVGDKLYVNVGDVTAMNAKKALACPELKNPAKYFDLDAPDIDVFKSFPEWVQKKISENLNFKGSPLDKLLNGSTDKKTKATPKAEEVEADVGDGDNSPY